MTVRVSEKVRVSDYSRWGGGIILPVTVMSGTFFVSRQRAVNLFAYPVTVTSTGNSRLTAFCIGDNMRDRFCTICREKKSPTDYNRNRSSNDGLSLICKECCEKRKKDRRKPRKWDPLGIFSDLENKRIMEQIKFQNRNARKKNAGGKIKKEEWQELKSRYEYKCLCCGRKEPEIKLTLDHIVPLSRGGTNTIDNVQPLCTLCNCRKYIQVIDYR